MKYRIVTAIPFEGKPTFMVQQRWLFQWIPFGYRRFSIEEVHKDVADYIQRKEEEKKFKPVQVWP